MRIRKDKFECLKFKVPKDNMKRAGLRCYIVMYNI